MQTETQTINSRLQAAAAVAPTLADGQAVAVPLGRIVANAYQPRDQMDEEDLERLMASIAQSSLLQNVLVRPLLEPGRPWDLATGTFALVAGHRRWTAFQRLLERAERAGDQEGIQRFATIPAIVRFGLSDDEQAINALEENIHRSGLNCWEEAKAVSRIRELMTRKEQGQVTDETVAERLGYEPKRVERLRFLAERAPQCVQDAISGVMRIAKDRDAARPRLDFHAAFAFTQLHEHALSKATTLKKAAKAAERTEHLVRTALEQGWPLRRIQEYVKAVKAGKARVEDAPAGDAANAATEQLFKWDAKRKTLTVSLAFENASEGALSAVLASLEEVAAAARKALGDRSVSADSDDSTDDRGGGTDDGTGIGHR